MKYQHLLYARSLSSDYRWIVIPSGVSDDDLRILKQFYDLFDDSKKSISRSSLPLLYCFHLTSGAFLVQCGLSGYEDEHGRDIYSMQGIFVDVMYQRHFWFLIPWLVKRHTEYLNVWQEIDFQNADSLRKHNPGEHRIEIDEIERQLVELVSVRVVNIDETLRRDEVKLRFTPTGLKELIALLATPYLPAIDFAFGATSQMLAAYPSFYIAAVFEDEKKDDRGFAPPNLNRDVTLPDEVARTSEQKQPPMTTCDLPVHHSDRFDPRKRESTEPGSTRYRQPTTEISLLKVPHRLLSKLILNKKKRR